MADTELKACPREPTAEMVEAVVVSFQGDTPARDAIRSFWRAMHDAAPSTPLPEVSAPTLGSDVEAKQAAEEYTFNPDSPLVRTHNNSWVDPEQAFLAGVRWQTARQPTYEDGLREAAAIRLLRQALEAIESARSEPLFIMRDAIRNWLEDNIPEDQPGQQEPTP